MAKFGDSYCWMIKDDPSVCPYIRPGEEYLINDVNKRIREKCIECEELKNDLKNLGEEKGPMFGTFSTVLDEFRKREQKLEKYGKSLKVKEEMFDTMAHLSTSLNFVLDLDEILYKVLVAFTAGSSFGFNRAIMLLSQKGKLRGYFAVGPKSPEEAYTIWNDISQKNLTIVDLLIFSPQLFQKEKEKFKEVLQEEIKAIEIFSTEISLALERGLTYEELEEKIETLEEANVKLKEHQELIMKLREEASIGEMVLQMTHSFKNPTIAIAGLARLLKKKTNDPSSVSKDTDAILEEAIKLEKTHKDFINFVKTKYTSEKTPIDINKVVELLYQEKKNKEKYQCVNFHLNLGSNLPLVLGNDYQLYNCIENIVSNSIEAMPEGGELFIETAEEDGFVSVGIKDKGPGISDG